MAQWRRDFAGALSSVTAGEVKAPAAHAKASSIQATLAALRSWNFVAYSMLRSRLLLLPTASMAVKMKARYVQRAFAATPFKSITSAWRITANAGRGDGIWHVLLDKNGWRQIQPPPTTVSCR
jgi:hypothetical protein